MGSICYLCSFPFGLHFPTPGRKGWEGRRVGNSPTELRGFGQPCPQLLTGVYFILPCGVQPLLVWSIWGSWRGESVTAMRNYFTVEFLCCPWCLYTFLWCWHCPLAVKGQCRMRGASEQEAEITPACAGH